MDDGVATSELITIGFGKLFDGAKKDKQQENLKNE
jgi:hypothetical protein